ncbi:MAG: hypothetical protein HYR90_02255 [Candidatus Andersenbacteria bacterium]|nr:hypothetical protein [Candidatus Andersenbacteria bacterium]MBI3250981.1 hypothetical protein [Candidatus Andersenbacteria bacterium]
MVGITAVSECSFGKAVSITERANKAQEISMRNMSQVRMACRALTEFDARCRNYVNGCGKCSGHEGKPDVGIAPLLLLTFSLSGKKLRAFKDQPDLRVWNRDLEKKLSVRQRHIDEAERLGRKAEGVYGQGRVDSGVLVFKDMQTDPTVQVVTVDHLWRSELEEAGYRLIDVHVEEDEKQPKGRLVIRYLDPEQVEFSPEIGQEISHTTRGMIDDLLQASFKYAWIYSNHPNRSGLRNDTLNMRERLTDGVPSGLPSPARLVVDGGCWNLE